MNHPNRNRVVTFRLSEEEYNALRSACGAEQDSVSAVARRTVLEWAQSVSEQPKVQRRLTEMDEKLDTLLGLIYRDRQLAAKVS
jgi:alkylation response protein AidB-like acyl-CoA dehydrogenase